MNGRAAHSILRPLIRPQPTSPFATYSLAHSLSHEPPRRHLSVNSFIPRVLSPSWWSQNLPKGLFAAKKSAPTVRRKWNPAWGYVLLALFVGSQSLNIMALRQERTVFMRRSDSRIKTLQEIIQKIQDGEWAPDGEEVRKALRLGKERDDRQWEDVMREIEEEDAKWQAEAQKQRERIEQEEAARAKFTALESPTAYADGKDTSTAAPQRPKKKITADDYFM
ncbi:hypothetical protein H072_2098 [Dactylellina haptotyla CBS 200.50]|uniref:Uncharacterized protein n=1 Tax=Dactylellina haptotyla (strain CBS 200.50) TaxID=1284197 RepID=S8ASE1_DACHA|nr:hypothetical protein H072_2098 [Dactylellina haptotyla CBS 200.50]